MYLYPTDPTAPTSPLAETASGGSGLFRLEAPAGTYIVVARTPDHFAFFGRNPIHLLSPQAGVHLPLLAAHPSVRRSVAQGDEAVEGRILWGETPVEGARAFAYLDLANGLRGPGYAVTEPAGADGAFHLPLPPGTYFVAARLRPGGKDTGPLQPGDGFGVAPEFPLVLRAGEAVTLDLEVVELPARERMARFQGRFARMTGVVVDSTGRPAPGFRVCLYDNAQMINQPAAVSDPTGPDGQFTLEVSLAGTYYLGARERLGGPPSSGERVGFYRDARNGRVELAPGSRLSDARIVLQAVP